VLAVIPIDVQGLDAIVGPKLASAVRTRLATPDEAPVFRERVATIEAHVGVPITVVATHGALSLECVCKPDPSATDADASRWQSEAAMHGHVVFAQAEPTQCAAGTVIVGDWSSGTSHTAALMTIGDVLRCSFGGDATAKSPPGEQFVHGLTASVTLVPRNGDGFGADVWLEWDGEANDALAKWLDSAPPQVTVRGSLGWIASASAAVAPSGGG
jgi:hypothetical protein